MRVVRQADGAEDAEVALNTEESSIEIKNLNSGTRYDVFVTSIGEEEQRSTESALVIGVTRKAPKKLGFGLEVAFCLAFRNYQ